MITLLTKDGSITGNGIIYGGSNETDFTQAITDPNYEAKPLFFVESDYGNHMKLTWSEIEEWYKIGKVMSYDDWKLERARLRERPDYTKPTEIEPLYRARIID